MIIKSADDKSPQISILQALFARPDITIDTKKRIQQEIKNIHAGCKGEREAAYEMNFHCESSNNWALIHDLRIVCDGRVAQIDHLVINRLMEIYVCESKHFSEGIAINEHGECSAFYGNKAYGIPSPFEQNTKHIKVLKSLFINGYVKLPTRLGLSIKPKINSLILVSKHARISRPKAKIAGIETILKNDQFKTHIDKVNEKDNNAFNLAKLIGSDTLKSFAKKLADMHIPICIDYYAKFGNSRIAVSHLRSEYLVSDKIVNASAQKTELENNVKVETEEAKKKLVCHQCGVKISFTVAKFCWNNNAKFGGNGYCMNCQRKV